MNKAVSMIGWIIQIIFSYYNIKIKEITKWILE